MKNITNEKISINGNHEKIFSGFADTIVKCWSQSNESAFLFESWSEF